MFKKVFYIFDGIEYVECTQAICDDIVALCEDNEVMIEVIKDYFSKGETPIC